MAGVARLGDSIKGQTSGEHHGHIDPSCSPSEITGSISGNCSSNVFVNGKPSAFIGSTTTEKDSCCGTSNGKVGSGSSSVFINGNPAARIGDSLNAHNGSATIFSGSTNVFINT